MFVSVRGHGLFLFALMVLLRARDERKALLLCTLAFDLVVLVDVIVLLSQRGRERERRVQRERGGNRV